MRNSRKAILTTFFLQFIFVVFLIARGVGAVSSGTVTSLFGGVGGSIPYQSAANTTAFLANGSAGQVLTSAGTTLPPIWAASSGGVAGSGTAGLLPRWAAGIPSTTLEDSRIVATNTLIQGNTGSGQVVFGDVGNTNNHCLFTLNDSSNTISLTTNSNTMTTTGGMTLNSGAAVTTLGDTSNVVNGTKITVTDSTSTIALGGNNLTLSRTVTAAGTTGNQTINKAAGTVNYAAGTGGAITVTNSFANASSLIFIQAQRTDATCTVFTVNAKGPGTFNILAPVACTVETPVAFWVTN